MQTKECNNCKEKVKMMIRKLSFYVTNFKNKEEKVMLMKTLSKNYNI